MNQLAPKRRRRSQLKGPWRFFEGRERIHLSKTRHEFGLPASSNRYQSSPEKRSAQRRPLLPGAKNREPSEDLPRDRRANRKSGQLRLSYDYLSSLAPGVILSEAQRSRRTPQNYLGLRHGIPRLRSE